jgi:hypothetical protein
MFDEVVGQLPTYIHDGESYLDLFDGDSLLEQGMFTSEIGKGDKAEIRAVEKDSIIDVYRNLNKTNFYSIRNRSGEFKNKVSGYAHAIIVRHPEFIVSKAGRARVQKEKRKNVHSFVRGQFCVAFNAEVIMSRLNDYLRVSYSPYVFDTFYTLDRDISGAIIEDSITPFVGEVNYEYALVTGKDVILFNL